MCFKCLCLQRGRNLKTYCKLLVLWGGTRSQQWGRQPGCNCIALVESNGVVWLSLSHNFFCSTSVTDNDQGKGKARLEWESGRYNSGKDNLFLLKQLSVTASLRGAKHKYSLVWSHSSEQYLTLNQVSISVSDVVYDFLQKKQTWIKQNYLKSCCLHHRETFDLCL